MREALTRVGEAVTDCLATTAWTLNDTDLLAALDAAVLAHRRMAAVVSALVTEVDGRDLSRREGATSTTAWLRHRHRMTGRMARHAVADAARWDTAPDPIRHAVTTGTVSIEQARVIIDTVDLVRREAGAEAADKAVGILLDWAHQFDPDDLRRLAHRILDHVAPHLAEDAHRRALEAAEKRHRRDRYLHLSSVGDGRLRLSGLLDVETSVLLRTAMDPLTKPAGPDDVRNPGQRRHDALTDICRLTLRTGDLPEHGGEPTQLVVTTTWEALTSRLGPGTRTTGHSGSPGSPDAGSPGSPDDAGSPGNLGPGQLDIGDTISVATVRRLACDAGVMPAVLNGDGQPLDLGRQRRLFTGAIRRALALRDGGCAFPGCDRPPRWTQAHHIVHWADGGHTDLDNGVLLCGHHHQAVHHDGWHIDAIPGGHPTFIPPPWIDPEQRPQRNTYHRRC
ncbi:DUF222 domain-containing protein [Plantactinospora sp. GCM10030261]|uniref:HNH endonuclease signature motif containing protein n=1 Tax=Plantactinospora sp. GCM10030261 TaxID=3273420 RepID=UPI0036127317